MPETPSSELMVLMFTDVAGSVELKTRFGAHTYAALIGRHDTLFRQAIASAAGAEILHDMGDGFLARFATAGDAVRAAVQFQRALAQEPWLAAPIRVRIGLHVGQVTLLRDGPDGPPKVIGLATDIAARLMGLALPGQTLLTRGAFDDARQYLRDEPGDTRGHVGSLRWMAHGRYLFKGQDEPLEVYEVGLEGVGPLKAPPDGDKARRCVAVDELEMLGWRPARGLEIPRRAGWVLERKLGEGGFGEVWLGRHDQTADTRVFKFCFDPQRLRSLKRELTLFRLIRSLLGERRDIARLYEVQLEQPPYFLESEYSEHGSLVDWARGQGGLALATRLDLVARTAEAVAAAHSVGILHKDIKPSNILIYYSEDGQPRPRLTDFGIGALLDRARLEERSIPALGFTETIDERHTSTKTGTQMYVPPESLVGKPFTIQGDVYSLGVLLFQMVAGDLELPLAPGWQRHIPDELLREDIAACVDGEPARRLPTADALADRLRHVQQRRAGREHAAEAARREARRRKLMRFGVVTTGVLAVLLALAAYVIVEERRLLARVSAAERHARDEARRAQAAQQFLEQMFASINPAEARGQAYTVRAVLDGAAARIEKSFADHPPVRASLGETLGRTYQNLGHLDAALPLLRSAVEIRRQSAAEHPAELAKSLMLLGALHHERGEFDAAEPLYREALTLCEKRADGSGAVRMSTLNTLAVLLVDKKDLDEAERVARQALELARQVHGPEHTVVSAALTTFATVRQCRGDFDTAERMLTQALELRQRLTGPENGLVVSSLNNLAGCQHAAGDAVGAAETYRRALAMARKVLPPGHWLIPGLESGLGSCLTALGRFEEAEPLLRDSHPKLEVVLGPRHNRTRQARVQLVELYEKWGKPDQAARCRVEQSAARPAP